MGTTYEEIYDKFTPLIEDVKLLSIDDSDVLEMMKEWLLGAINDYQRCGYDLSDRDDDAETFNVTLPEFDQNVLAHYMVTEWISPQLNSTLLTRQFIGGNGEKFFAQANQLDKLLALESENKIKTQKMLRDYGYIQNLVKNTTT